MDHPAWKNKQPPCVVKAVVHERGMVASIGLKATQLSMLEVFLQDADRFQRFRDLLRQQVDRELARHEVTHGIKEGSIVEAVDTFLDNVVAGEDEVVSRRVAEGTAPEEGMDGYFDYSFNLGGKPLKFMEPGEQREARHKVHRVKEGESLVYRQPSQTGGPGQNVHGKSMPSTYEPREAEWGEIAGANTQVQGDKLVSTLEGVYREDLHGGVRVVQEVEVEEVNATTGDLPAAGIGDVNVLVHKGVFGGTGVSTSEDLFIGAADQPGLVEDGTRLRCRNLCIRGQLAGGQLPEPFLNGEIEGLEEAERNQILGEVDNALILVEQTFVGRDATGRNIRAEEILVQSHAYNAALEAQQAIWIDGHLVGGVVVCGGRLQIVGDLGNSDGSPTRIQLDTRARQGWQTQRLKGEVAKEKRDLTSALAVLQEHMATMEERGKNSEYWAALLKDEQRAPEKPVERQILEEFNKAKKRRQQLELKLRQAQRHVWDLENALSDEAGEDEMIEGGMRIGVGGTIYPGVSIELVRPLEAADLEQDVQNREGMGTSLKSVKAHLEEQVERYLDLYRDAVAERQEALEKIYKDKDQAGAKAEIPDKRFQEYVVFKQEEGEGTLGKAAEGLVYVYAHAPGRYFLKQTRRLSEPLSDVTLTVERGEVGFALKCKANPSAVPAWEKDGEVLGRLEEIQVMGRSARTHLLGESKAD